MEKLHWNSQYSILWGLWKTKSASLRHLGTHANLGGGKKKYTKKKNIVKSTGWFSGYMFGYMFKWCKVKWWLQVSQCQGCSHYYSTMHLYWHCAESHRCSNAFCQDLYQLSQKWWFVLFMTYGQETAKFVSGSTKGFHSLQFWDMPFKTERADVALTWSMTTE